MGEGIISEGDEREEKMRREKKAYTFNIHNVMQVKIQWGRLFRDLVTRHERGSTSKAGILCKEHQK